MGYAIGIGNGIEALADIIGQLHLCRLYGLAQPHLHVVSVEMLIIATR